MGGHGEGGEDNGEKAVTLIGMGKWGGAIVEVCEFCLGGMPRGSISWTCKSKAKERPGV